VLRRVKRAIRAQDGQALVELALALPILLVILFGIFDFGTAISNWNSETSLANVGARYAAVGALPNSTEDPTCGTNTTISTYLACQAQKIYSLPTTANGSEGLQGPVSVTVCAPGGTAVGDPVEVKVTAPYDWLPTWSFVNLNPGSLATNVTATATMRIENVNSSWGTFSTTC
jgi:Flp pilus assembly protein TadG